MAVPGSSRAPPIRTHPPVVQRQTHRRGRLPLSRRASAGSSGEPQGQPSHIVTPERTTSVPLQNVVDLRVADNTPPPPPSRPENVDNPETELEPDPDMDYILHRPFHRHRLLRLYPDENVRQNVDRGQNVDQHGVASADPPCLQKSVYRSCIVNLAVSGSLMTAICVLYSIDKNSPDHWVRLFAMLSQATLFSVVALVVSEAVLFYLRPQLLLKNSWVLKAVLALPWIL